jgi:hypothetical protein
MEDMNNAYSILVWKSEGKRPLVLDVDWRVMLECVLGKQDEEMLTGCIWLRTGTSGGLL